ncbi:MAG: hypothetical protein AAB455_03725 [Patescibacteria group bacterium]
MIKIINFITSAELQLQLFWLKAAFFAFTAAGLAFLLIFLIRTRWFKLFFLLPAEEFLTKRPFNQRSAAKRWSKVRQRFSRPVDERACRRALKQAVGILDDYLEDLVPHFQAKTLSERLKLIGPVTIGNIGELRQTVELAERSILDATNHLSIESSLIYLEILHHAFIDLGLAEKE